MKTLISLLFVIVAHGASAQLYLGAKVGATFSNFKSPTHFKEGLNPGLVFALASFAKINYDWGLYINLEYVEKGYHHYACNTIYERFETTFIEAPVLLDYSIPFSDRLKFHLRAGGYFAYWLNGKYESEGYKPSSNGFDFKKNGASRFDFGPSAGAELDLLLHNGNLLGIDFRYDLGINDLQQSPNEHIKNTSRSLMIGLNYRIKFLRR